jgi:hypothetical protein
MVQTVTPRLEDRDPTMHYGKDDAYSHGVSWPAVIGGAFVAAALSLILLTLGTGLGFSALSPWSNMGASAAAIGMGAIVWLIVTQILASAFGGYLGGRLRTKWVRVHTDEVYFRDTAHGLLVWAVGIVITAGFLASAAASFAGAVQKTPTGPNGESALDPNAYFVDTLLRSNGSPAQPANGSPAQPMADRMGVTTTFAHDLRLGAMPSDDKAYLSQVVSSRSGMSAADAEQRVSSVFAQAQESADRTRKALAYLSLWLFVALLCGAFSASYAGTIGGRQRDHVAA